MPVDRLTDDGIEVLALRNPMLEVRLAPACGSNVYALRDLKSGLSILSEPPQVSAMKRYPFSYGTPVLFPPNRIEGGKFEWGGRTYTLDLTRPQANQHIHGVVANQAWDVESASDGEEPSVVTVLRSWERPDVIRQWPHHFELQMTTQLYGLRVSQDLEIRNVGEDAMPWGLGYHTRFNVPVAPDGNPADCIIKASVDGSWELSEQKLPTGRVVPSEAASKLPQGIPANSMQLDDLFRAAPPNAASLTDKKAGITVSYHAGPQFKFWIVFNLNLPEANFKDHVCFEPYTWLTNAPNLPVPYDVSGVNSLNPGESVTCHTEFNVSHEAEG